MKKILFLFIIFSSYISLAQPNNINLSSSIVFGGEPYLAVNPTNRLNVVVAWMALDVTTNYRMSIKSKVSFDGGTTWGNPFVQPHFGSNWSSADVSMQFRPNGILYMSYIDFHKPDVGGVYVTNSSDGGISWSAPTQVWDAAAEDPTKRPLDRPWLAIDNSGTASDGTMYIATKPAPWISPPNRPYLKTSINLGQNWSPYRYVDTTNHLVGNLIAAPMPFPTITADGALCIAYPSYVVSQSPYPKILLAKSYSKGATFQYYDLIVNSIPVQDTLYKLGYRLIANPIDPNQLAYAFVALGQANGDPDIFVATSNNGGTSWNSPVRVNDDSFGNGKAQDMVWANYDINNKLVVTWRDRRNSSGSGFFQSCDTYTSVSTDNGAHFSPNVRLSNVTAAFDSILGQSGNDFMSCELSNDTIYAAWGDVRSGKINIYFAKSSDITGAGSGIIPIDETPAELIAFYPNPTTNKLKFKIKKGNFQTLKIVVQNELGEEILSKAIDPTLAESEIDVSRLSTGTYFLCVVNQLQIIQKQKITIEK